MKSTAERIRRLVRLTARERHLLLRAWWYLLAVDLALRLVPVTWLLRRSSDATARAPVLPMERMAWLLALAARYSPVRRTCLKDALVLARMLRAEGLAATVRIGVARHGGGLRAHAWVEHRGAVVFGAPDHETYEELVSAPEARAAR